MKRVAFVVLAAVTFLTVGCGPPALTCQTQDCPTGSGKTYQLCVNVNASETWKFGGMSCSADTSETSAVETCVNYVDAYCGGGGEGGSGGTGGNDGTGGSGGAAACTYTVSGAQTGSGSCTAEAAYAPGDAGVAVALIAADGSFNFAATLAGLTTLTAGTYDDASAAPGYGGEYTVGTGASTGVYVLCSTTDNCNDAQGSSFSPGQGSFTLEVTDPGPSMSAGGGAAWLAPQGSLIVTLPAQPGGPESGTVIVTVTL